MTTTDPYRFEGGAENPYANGPYASSPYPSGPYADNPYASGPYTAGPSTAGPDAGRDGVTRDGVVRTVLWLLLVVSTVGNMAASFGAASTQVHLVCGAVTALCATVLVVRHLRGRR
ncbi:hypothetical protein [Streptomyces apricus]|uniref:Uncharacterized protein n=1 Tax=Streptomyces apricus TaxID=1828112 RepID=A0A5B0BME3_9ACTN|nr:hypothetical protein [Streptomyces apricus]KAA0942816.1 hypothetical protein FGF04_00865 [Streptomyces apricus]